MGLGLCPRHLWRTEDGVSSHSGGSPFYSDYEGHSTWYLLSLDCWIQLIDRGPFCEIKPAPLKVQSQDNYNVTGTRKKAFCSKEEMKFRELNFLFLLFCTRGEALLLFIVLFVCERVYTHVLTCIRMYVPRSQDNLRVTFLLPPWGSYDLETGLFTYWDILLAWDFPFKRPFWIYTF